jgi:hypothetical protein
LLTSTRWTSKTVNSSSSPYNTDVASDMLVASLLDVVGDQQHVGHEPHQLRHELQSTPLKFEEPVSPDGTFTLAMRERQP